MKSRSLRGQADVWFRRGLVWLAGSALVLSLPACSDRSQELEEQVTQLRKELDRSQDDLRAAQRSLAHANDELASLKSTPGTSAGSRSGLPSRQSVEESYMAATKELRNQIQSKLNGFTIETCTLHSVIMPEELFPFTSQISLSLRSVDGQPFQLSFPVKADINGRWVFPATDEIVERIKAAREGRSVAAVSEAHRSGGSQSVRPDTSASALPSVMEAGETVVIDWPENRRPPSPPPNAPAAPAIRPAPAPEIPGRPAEGSDNPSPVMPVDRDVLIKF